MRRVTHALAVACLGSFLTTLGAGCAGAQAEDRANDRMHAQASQFKRVQEDKRAAARAADRHAAAVTAQDQSTQPHDFDITRSIRQALMHDEDLSLEAKNVAVITQDGVVTLKGFVQTEAEKSAIHEHAEKVAGVRRVEDRVRVE
jgi:osmotically-inducible protein OsmY